MINHLLNEPYITIPEVRWTNFVVTLRPKDPAWGLFHYLKAVNDGERIHQIKFNEKLINTKESVNDLFNEYSGPIEEFLIKKITELSTAIFEIGYTDTSKMGFNQRLNHCQIDSYRSDRNVIDLMNYYSLLLCVVNHD